MAETTPDQRPTQHSTQHSTWARHLATTFGLGDLLPAPGTTAGSLPAALLWGALVLVLPWPQVLVSLTAVLAAVAMLAGIWAADLEARRRGKGDPGPVVIDEVAGQLVTYLVALPFLPLHGWREVVLSAAAGFLLFRIFDIVKPWPARQLERLPGGFGIVADDIAAGIEAGTVLALLSPWLPRLGTMVGL